MISRENSRMARMAQLLISLILLSLSLMGCDVPPVVSAILGEATPAGITQLHTRIAPAPSDTEWEDRTIFAEGLIVTERSVLGVGDLAGATVYHLALQIASDYRTVTGQQTVRYTNCEVVPLDEVYFRIFPNTAGGTLTVTGVRVMDEDVEARYEYGDSALRVPLAPPLPPGRYVDISMDFSVEIPTEMGGNYGLFGFFDDILVLDESYPVIPVFDDEGWNVETPPPNADVSYVDASFYLVRVTAPADLVLVASGVEVGREYQTDANTQTVTIAAGPIRDFYLAASSRFSVVSEKVGETTINSYAAAEYGVHAKLALDVAAHALKTFNSRLGTYPYTEFDLVSTPMQALGMEYPGAAAMALTLYDPDKSVGGIPSRVHLESATAHEVGHQWFYNVVTNDQVDEPWLDEANVQYLTGIYYLDRYGAEGAQGFIDSWYGRWNRVDGADIPIGLPAGEYEGAEYGAIVYGRGPLFIQALAEAMGQDTFDEFYRDYYQTHKWGIGTGEGFKQLAERHCQCDLTPLFEEWVYPQ